MPFRLNVCRTLPFTVRNRYQKIANNTFSTVIGSFIVHASVPSRYPIYENGADDYITDKEHDLFFDDIFQEEVVQADASDPGISCQDHFPSFGPS